MRPDKTARHDLLRRLLADQELGSHADVLHALANDGVTVNQGTVSRDLAELGVLRARGADGRPVYRLPDHPPALTAHDQLVTVLRQFVLDIDASGNLAVLRTPPACAQPVASAIDLASLEEALATVGGDDTVLVVAREPARGRDLADRLGELRSS